MPVIVVTRLRLSDPALFDEFFASAVAVTEQAEHSDGNLGAVSSPHAKADRRSWAAALDAIARYDRADRTASISAPATLIAAGLDQVSTPAAMSALAGRLPRATLQILPGAAHMTPFTDPAALAQLILSAVPPR